MFRLNVRQTTKSISIQVLAALVSAVAAVALPQLCHRLGTALGVGSAIGEIWLPMHLPVLLCGLLAGPVAGMVAGAAAPLISVVLTGMPAFVMMPVMVAELVVYGLVAGLLKSSRLPLVAQVLTAQAAGRLLRAGIVVLLIGLDLSSLELSAAYANIITGLPGMALQLVLLPLIVRGVEKVQR